MIEFTEKSLHYRYFLFGNRSLQALDVSFCQGLTQEAIPLLQKKDFIFLNISETGLVMNPQVVQQLAHIKRVIA